MANPVNIGYATPRQARSPVGLPLCKGGARQGGGFNTPRQVKRKAGLGNPPCPNPPGPLWKGEGKAQNGQRLDQSRRGDSY